MDDASRAELAALRRRAYGPAADITADPAALARLSELEAHDRAVDVEEHAEAGADERVVQDADDGGARFDALVPGAAAVDGAASDHDDARPVGVRPRPVAAHWIVGWAASIVLVGVVVGAVVFGLASVPPVATAAGRQIATLTERVDVPPEITSWTPGGIATGYRFEGLIIVPTPIGVGPFGAGSECLLVAPADGFQSDGSVRGETFWSCRAGGFPASVQFVVSSSAPEALRARFDLGTALMFVLDGDRVGVFTDPPSSPSPSPA